MDKKNLLQIGELAKICGISIQALRYYDKIGFIRPDYIDKETKYRYYSRDKIFYLTNTKYLQESGFTLHEIQTFLQKQKITEITELYNTKLHEIDRQIDELIVAKNRITCHLEFFNNLLNAKSEKPHFNIGKIKIINNSPTKVVFIRNQVIFDYPSMMFLYNQLIKLIFDHRLSVHNNIITVFHGGYTDIYHKKTDIELCMFIDNDTSIEKSNTSVRELNYPTYATCIHKGKYPLSTVTYNMMQKWLADNNYVITGPVMHILLVPIVAAQKPEDTVFEIRIPVKTKK